MSEQRRRRDTSAINLGLAANVVLAMLKTSIGILGHSPALLADGINSTSDAAHCTIVSVFMRLASKPPDEEHPYGHSQMESIAAVVVGSFVMTTAVAIFWDAVNNVYDLLTGQGDFGGAAIGTLWMALFTVAVKLALTVWTRRVGEHTRNAAVLALAHDHRNDVFSALAATTGIFFGRMGYPWVDPMAGALVALIILRTGIGILRESTADLMDTLPGKALAQQITELIAPIPGVLEIEDIHAHRFGPFLVANVTVCVDGSISVVEGDGIATQVEQTLIEHIEYMKQVHVHYHPASASASTETTHNR
jgi:cation diffusion facilitator family transporter